MTSEITPITAKESAARQWFEAQKRKEDERQRRAKDEQRRKKQTAQASAVTVAALQVKAAKKREEAAKAAKAVAKALAEEQARQEKAARKVAEKEKARAANKRQKAEHAARIQHARKPAKNPSRKLVQPVPPGTYSYKLMQQHAARMDAEQKVMFAEELRRNGIELRPAAPRSGQVRREAPPAVPARSAGRGRALPELDRERYEDPVPDPAVVMAAKLRGGGTVPLPPDVPQGRDDDDEWRPHDRRGPYGQRRRRKN
ncbi:hypothetical protein ACIF6L_34385 [Kitasatospora sp. NPDC086009]|uniref:hypothetical protein n=1 Tax=unclassified Kitasatospora TaxID=2633591 RepID=UPI0037C5D562